MSLSAAEEMRVSVFSRCTSLDKAASRHELLNTGNQQSGDPALGGEALAPRGANENDL